MNKDEIVAVLHRIAEMAAFSINTGGRDEFDPRGVEDELNSAADIIEEQAKVIETMTKALKGVLDEHTYEAPAGNTNCRFCDNDMDHEGTFEDMHEPDCIIHFVRSAVAISKALPSES